MSKKKSPAHLVLLGELLAWIPESEKIEEQMALARKQFGNDSPYHSQWLVLATKCQLLLNLMGKIEIPAEDKIQVIEKLELLKETPIPGYKDWLEIILAEF